MKIYELTYIISPELSTEEAEAKAKETESAVQKIEGVIISQNNPVAKTFAYPIQKTASGFLATIEFQLENAEKVNELKDILAKDVKIVRDMIIIKKATKPMKERRTRTKPISIEKPEEKQDQEAPKTVETKPASKEKEKDKDKVELKDIEQKLDELLSE